MIWLAVSTRDGVQFWDTSTWQITHSVHSKNRRILLDATADGRRLVCVDPTLTFRFLDTATGQTLAYARGVWPLPWAFIAQWIRNAAKPDVRWMRLAVTITSRIRDSSLARRTAHIVAEILEYFFSIKSLRWPGGVVTSSYGDWLAVGFLGATACVLHTGTGRMLAALDYDFRVGGVAFVAHGRWLVTAAEGQVQVWDTATWRIKPTPQLSHLRVTTWAVNPAGTLLAAGLLEGTISIFETTTWRCVTEMRIDDWLRRRACEWLTESLLRIHGGRGLYLFTYETPDPECPQG